MTEAAQDHQDIGIAEAAQASGVAESTLRMWEKRYHWPQPRRLSSGFRVYTPEQVADIRRLGELIANGFKIGEIVLDGTPHWPTTLVPKPERPAFDFSDIPLPASDEARRIRQHLEEAIVAQDQGAIARIRAMAPTLRPAERGPAILALLAIAGLADGSTSNATTPEDPLSMSTEPTTASEPETLPVPPVAAVPATEVPAIVVSVPDDEEAVPAAPAGDGFDLATALRAKMTADGLSIGATAKAIDVSPAAIGNILSKGSRPNARTATRFAAWLGVDAALLTGGKAAATPTAKRGRPGRKPKVKIEKPAKTEEKGDKGEKPAKPGRRGPKRKAAFSTDEVLAIVRNAIEGARSEAAMAKPAKAAESHPILKDALAMMVHEASADLRSALKAMLALAKKR